MKRFRLVALYFLVPICIYVVGCNSSTDAWAGKSAPDFTVESLSQKGKQVGVKDFRGKVVLIDFWATWCGPCRELMPAIEGLHEKYGAKGLEVMAISAEERLPVEKFCKDNPHGYPVYLDNQLDANQKFNIDAFPTVFVVGRSGKVVASFLGGDVDGISTAVDKAISE